MKKLMALILFLLAVTALPAAADGLAVIEKIQGAEESNAAKNISVTRAAKEVVASETDSLDANDVVDTANKAVTLKTQNGSIWSLEEKTKFSILPAQGDKAVYALLDGAAEYKAGDKAGEILVKINGKDLQVSAGAKVYFSRAAEITSFRVSEGTVKFGKQTFERNTTVKIDAQGNVTIPKMRGIRG